MIKRKKPRRPRRPLPKHGTSPALTSPAASGVFLFPSSAPFNGPAFAPHGLPRAAALPAALPLCAVRPLPPRPGQARPPRRPCRPSAALSFCRFPCPVPPVSRAALGKPRPARLPACLAPPRPLAAAGRSNPLPRPPCRPPRRPGRAATAAGRPPVIHAAAAGGKKGGLQIKGN